MEEDGSKNDDRAGPPRFASEERRELAEVNKVSLYVLYFQIIDKNYQGVCVTQKHNLNDRLYRRLFLWQIEPT